MSRPAHLPSSTVDVSLHVYETSRLSTRVYPAQGRATVEMGGTGGAVTVYAGRAELVRLRDALAGVVAELDAARAKLAADLAAELAAGSGVSGVDAA